jgi:hypothetical protein
MALCAAASYPGIDDTTHRGFPYLIKTLSNCENPCYS